MAGANMQCITTAEQKHQDQHDEMEAEAKAEAEAGESKAHISLAA